MSILAIITAATLTRVETDFLELVFFIDAGMPLCVYNEVYKWPLYLNSQDFYARLANRCPENTDPLSTV